MGIKATPATAKAGVVTFKVTNDFKDTIHEMIVMYLADPSQAASVYRRRKQRRRGQGGRQGRGLRTRSRPVRIADRRPSAGTYLLICNVPGHYAAGMWTKFEVTK